MSEIGAEVGERMAGEMVAFVTESGGANLLVIELDGDFQQDQAGQDAAAKQMLPVLTGACKDAGVTPPAACVGVRVDGTALLAVEFADAGVAHEVCTMATAAILLGQKGEVV